MQGALADGNFRVRAPLPRSEAIAPTSSFALADENDRAELLSLISANKRASNLLVSYLNIDWAWHPLLYLKSYLADQTGGAVRTKATEENKGSQPPPGTLDSPPKETDPPYPGERYPQTRARFLTKTEVAALSYAQLRKEFG